MTQHGTNSNALETKKLVLGQPQLISMTTAATYNAAPGLIYKENLRNASVEMRATATGKEDLCKENSNLAMNQILPAVPSKTSTLVAANAVTAHGQAQ